MERTTHTDSAIDGAYQPEQPDAVAANIPTDMQAEVDLKRILFSAKIDYVTLEATGKVTLPVLSGKASWPPSVHYKVLTIHDPSPKDLLALRAVLGDARITELEVAVDVRPRPGATPAERLKFLELIMVRLFAFGLDPRRGKAMRNQFRAFYRQVGSKGITGPFNMRLPLPSDQQLNGGRTDDAQVKAYLKGKDQGAALKPKDHVSRVEARLSGEGLAANGVETISDLFGFKFRQRLMPYFTHVEGTRRSKRKGKLTTVLRNGINLYRDKEDLQLWRASGVGAFLEGGKGKTNGIRLIRNTQVNDRIGQALNRLERAYQVTESGCLRSGLSGRKPYVARPPAEIGGQPITT